MKNNYFKSFFKAFGIIPAILVVLVFSMIGFIVFKKPEILASMIVSIANGVLLAALAGGALLGLTKLRNEKFGLFDFIRVSFMISSLIVGILSVGSKHNESMIVFFVLAAVFLVECVLRAVFCKDDSGESGYKNYFSALAYRFNPLILMVCGVAVAVVLTILAKNNIATAVKFLAQGSFKFVVLGGAIAAIIMMIIAAIDKDTDVTILDFVMAVLFVGSMYSLVVLSAEIGTTFYKMLIIIVGVSAISLLIRAIFYNKDAIYDDNRFKIKTYYKGAFGSFDIPLALFCGAVLVGVAAIVYGYATKEQNALMTILKAILPFGPRKVMATEILGLAIIAILLVLIAVFRGFTSHEIVKTDWILIFLLFGTGVALPLLIILLMEGKFATLGTFGLVVVVVYLAVFVIALILQMIRIRAFDPMAAIIAAEAAKRAEEAKAKKAAEEKAIEEEAAEEEEAEKEEEFDPFALTEEDEAIYEAAYGKDEEPEEEAPVEEVVEEPVEEVYEEVVEEPVEEVYEEVVEEAPAQEFAAPAEEEEFEDLEDETEEDVEDEEEELEEGEEVEESQFEETKEAGIVVQDFQVVDEDGQAKKIKRKFNTKMMFAPYETKEYYNEIKNYLMMYRAKGRYSSRCESYRYKGLVAKVALGGKSVKVFLALDPSYIDEFPKYHLKNVSDKKQYAEVPVMIKVRSERALKYFKELVDIMFANRLVKPKRNYEPTNFIPQLIPNGEAILATLGMSTDYLQDSMNARGIPEEMPDDLIDYLPMIPGDDLEEEEVEATVYLDTLCNHFNDGDEITIDVLKSLHIVTKGNVLRIRARGTLDRKLIIYAEKFDEDALKMLMCTNCTAIHIIR